MQNEVVENEDDDGEYYVLPEQAFELLPKEWQEQLEAMAADGRAVLKSVDNELSQFSRISNSINTLAALKYVQTRLSEYRFAAEMDAILELEMLTTAFVVTYARLHSGGNGSGFSRDALPEKLRSVHDQILELRNKRFAHSGDHHTVENAIELEFCDNRYEIHLSMTIGYHIGGASEWKELVEFVDKLVSSRCDKLLDRLKDKTGHDWALAQPPQVES